MIIDKTGYMEYLQISQQDFDSRWENVLELVRMAFYCIDITDKHCR